MMIHGTIELNTDDRWSAVIALMSEDFCATIGKLNRYARTGTIAVRVDAP